MKMKKALFFLGVWLIAQRADAQHWKVSIDAGMVFSQMAVKHLYESEIKNGISAGICVGSGIQYSFNKYYNISSGIYFTRIGKKETTHNEMVTFSGDFAGYYTHREYFKLSYLQLPIVFEKDFYSRKLQYSVGLGGYFRMALQGKIFKQMNVYDYKDQPSVTTFPKVRPLQLKEPANDLKNYDAGILLSGGIKLNRYPVGIHVEAGYGLVNTMPAWKIPAKGPIEKMHTLTCEIGLRYGFRF